MSKAISDIEIAGIIDAGYSKETIDGWLAVNWSREDILDYVKEEWTPAGITTIKKGLVRCPICNELFWNKALNPHIFKTHMNELLAPFNKPHNADRLIQQVTVPLEIQCPVFDNDTNDDINPRNQIYVREDQEDRVFNPKTNRWKKIVKTRRDNIILPPQLYYCIVCSKAWTSEKCARKHFVGIKGLSDCTGAKQLIKINHARGIVTPKYEAFAQVAVRVPDVSLNDDLNKEVSILELQQQNKLLKDENKKLKDELQLTQKKLKEHVTVGIKKDDENKKLLDKIEHVEGEIEMWKGKYEQDMKKPELIRPAIVAPEKLRTNPMPVNIQHY